MPIDQRDSLLIEKLDSGKTRLWVCNRTPAGRTIFDTARRTSSIPQRLLGRVWRVLRDLDAETQQPPSSERSAA